MTLFDLYARKAEAIAKIGEQVRAEARRTGTTISYMEEGYGDDIIREYPDGRRERLLRDGRVQAIPPRAG
ncbi:hypothetical protein G3576_00565 [Roseomonas stagni]|uniref:Uncharacterized protein n=1 Tax=Falsiroseomonas algicola TaxID=2716930 RepID=A0A6M1LDW7_9PROT|nr:hypothetical protein [Falsiroseomonas algicola]NGM18485.1 hypothetical protein [Falsiroseomonas algicola]